MTSKDFYKYVISKSTPILLGLLFLPGCIWIIMFYEENAGYFFHYIFICISIILIFEVISTFIRTLFILHRRKITDKNRIRLYLFYIPYLPSIIGCTIYTLCLLKTKTVYHRSLMLFIYAFNSTLNFIFSMILNTKLDIFRFISDEPEKEANEERIENK